MKRRVGWLQRGISGVTAAALLVVQLALPQRAEASHLGSSTASAGSAPPPAVSAIQSFQPDLFTGRATTSIPIAVPPGRKGMQPSLALGYSSSGRNGWVGVGWGLDLGAIERSTKNGVPTYGASDTFTFMFQGVSSDLVRIPDGTYRAKDEGLFLRFESRGTSGWEVRDKSGTRYLFGRTTASQIERTGSAFRWCLDQVIDTNGNSLTLTYTKDQGQLYPSSIRYTSHEPTQRAPTNRITFLLEDRPDDEVNYRSGFAVTTAKRLKEIATYAPDPQGQPLQLARKYVLVYTTSGRTGRSLLASVQQVGTDGTTSLPPTTLTYQSTGAAGYPNILNNFASPPSVAGWNVRVAGLDTGHETWGCANPYMGLPWGSPSVATGGFNLGCVSGSVSGNGDVTMNGCNDHFGHVWTYVYVSQAKTISLSHSNSNDAVGCLYREDAGGVTQITNPGSIPLQAGWSLLHITAYHQHQGWGPTTLSGGIKSQVDVMNPSQITLGVPQLAGDVNGDARTDIIKFTPSSGNWSVSCATSCTLPPGGTWLSGFGNNASLPLLGDWNGDGKTDVAIFTSGTWRFATSTGTNFQADTMGQVNVGSGTPLTGDFNGDAIMDIGTYNNGSWSVALGTGSSFSSTGSFSLSWGDASYEALTGDFNGDGLTDIGIINKSSGAIDVRLSTGSNWTGASNWIGSFGGANPHTSADFNGDGLTDAAYYNRSAGQVIYAPSIGSSFGSTVTLPLTFSLTSSDDQIQVGDFNGDSIADPAAFNILSGSSQLALSTLTNGDGSNGTAPDLLRTIANGLGGTTTIKYQPSSLCGCDQESILPFVLPVVQQATSSDGLGHSYATTYLFHGGLYDAPTKEFRGFAKATVFDVEGNKSITAFHQDAHKKGRPFRSEFRDQYDTLWTKTEQSWSSLDPSPGIHFVKLDQTDGYTYDGDATFRQVRTASEYDAFGNLTKVREFGDVAAAGDERQTFHDYTSNEAAWIVNRLAHTKLTDAIDETGVTVSEQWFYYDGRLPADPGHPQTDTTPPSTGLLTAELEWLDTDDPQDPNPLTKMTYDAYGNVTAVTDALGRTTTNTYDASGTYLVQIRNTLGHTRELAYDPRSGAVMSSTDQNGVTMTTAYDALGRVTKVIGPTDTAALPTIEYEYDLSTIPAKTVTNTRIASGSPLRLTHDAFHDGLGRTIQTRSPAEDPTKQVVTGAVELNPRGLVSKQWVPYLSSVSSSYVPLTLDPSPLTLAAVSYTYDPLGRLLTTRDPDGSTTSTSYDDWAVTATDANNHSTRRTQDAFGRLATVEELTGTETYTTTYAYDALGNLSQVTDARGNVTRITYDSLQRKLSMDDPDMGRWTYAYDAVDNLTAQTDARGVTIAFTYDALNRLTQKSYTVPSNPSSSIQHPASVVYTYDDPAVPFSKGKLTGITDGSGSSSFTYDTLGRLITETKMIDGIRYTVNRSYDLFGRLTNLTYPDSDVANYTYNPQGGLETVSLDSLATGHSPLVTDVVYNAAGQLTKITYGSGTVSDYTYNPQTLRLSALSTQHTATSTVLQDFRYTFDPAGNVTQIQDLIRTGTQAFQYDALNRLTQATGSYGTQTYAYDPIGNMTSKEGAAMTYGLADGSKPHAVTAVHSPQSIVHSLTYDANGNMLQKAMDYGPSTMDYAAQQFAYDAENRLVEVKTAPEETVTVTFQPGWNFFSLPVIPNDPKITSLFPTFSADFEQIAWFDTTLSTSDTQRFKHFVHHPKFNDFDTLEYGQGYQVYCKNPSGVTITITGKLPTSQASTTLLPGWHLLPATTLEPKPLSWLTQGLDATVVRVYDAVAQTLKPATEITQGQAYFVNIRTSSLFTPPLPRDPSSRFVYDGDGGRVKQITVQGTTTFLGQSYEKVSSGKTTKYIFAGSQRLAAKDSTGALRFYHTDHLGSSNVVTDGTGAVVEVAEYTPYGSLHKREGTVNVPQKFTGQRFDSESGLYFYNARYYDPILGRFISPDSIVQTPADPQTLNRYSYARNNPLRYVDPSGNFWFIPFIIAAVKAVVAFAVAHPVVFGAIVGGITNVATNTSQIRGVGDVAKFAAVGAASGAIGTWTGIGMFGTLSGSLGAFGGGLVSAAAGGLTGGFTGGTGNALAGGASVRQALAIGVQTAVVSAVVSTALFVAGYGIVRTVQAVQGARATQQASGTRTSAARGQPNQNRIVVGPLEAPNGTPLESGTKTVYRVWGGESGPHGKSWTTTNPSTTPNYRGIAGLPPGNTGEFVSQGILRDPSGVTTRSALPLGPNQGGLPEVVIPNPQQQVDLKSITMPDDPY